MYNEHFGLSEKPFALSPDPGFLYFTKSHRLAMTMLEYGIQNESGFTLISGEVGCGKTTLIRYLLRNLDDSYTVGLISNTHESFGELIDLVLLAFDLEYKNKSNIEKYHTFENFLLEQYGMGQNTILIVDEAQNLSSRMLEELRVISNINSEKDQLFQIVLSGQPEIRETLRMPELKQFAQRISSDFHLTPLTLEQLTEYIKHRLKVAGARQMLFTNSAIRMIFNFSKGVPRVANTFCDLSLVYAYADGLEAVDWRTVMRVAIDKKNSGAVGIL
ncbi:MAG: AAA family ATPase [Gammaproteobacteria bacterium]|nr:AAA family ATPase [Gammaproteobacteria bacterium]